MWLWKFHLRDINKLWFRLNNHKKIIRDNSSVFSVAVHFNQTDHSHKNLRCIILRGDIKTTANRLIYEQTFIRKLEAHWKCVDQDLSFLSPYSYFHMCWQHLAATSDNYTEVWRQKQSEVLCVCVCVRIYASTPLLKDTGVFEVIGCFIIVLLD